MLDRVTLRQKPVCVVILDKNDKHCKLVTSKRLHPQIYKDFNAYSMYIFLYINRHVECISFTLAKAGKGRACPPVIINIAFTYFITSLYYLNGQL